MYRRVWIIPIPVCIGKELNVSLPAKMADYSKAGYLKLVFGTGGAFMKSQSI